MFFRHHHKKDINLSKTDEKVSFETTLPEDIQRYMLKFFTPKKLYPLLLVSKTFNKLSHEILDMYKTNIFYTVGSPMKIGEYSILYRFGAFKYKDKESPQNIHQSFHGKYKYYPRDATQDSKVLVFNPPAKPSDQVKKTHLKKEALMELFRTEDEAGLRADSLRYNTNEEGFQPAIFKVMYLGEINNLQWDTCTVKGGALDRAYADRADRLIPLTGTMKIMFRSGKPNNTDIIGVINYNDSHEEENKSLLSKHHL